MIKKLFSLFLLMIVASLAIASAQITISQPGVLTKSLNSTTLTISNPANSNVSYNIAMNPINITDNTNILQITATPSAFALANGTSQAITLSYSILPSLVLGSFSTQISAFSQDNSSINASTTLSFVNSFCRQGDIGDIIEITKLEDEKLDNADEWQWSPLDNIEITVKVHNSADRDLDVTLEYGLYNPSTKEFDVEEDTIDLSIDKGKSEETSIKFQVPSDIDERSDYRFYVKAYKEGEERKNCTDKENGNYYKDVETTKETRSVVLDEIKTESTYLCGDNAEIKARVSNIGKEDEEKVLVNLYNKELGINMNKVLENFDSGDDETISFLFKIPENATEKTYNFELKTRFKYDDKNSGCDNNEDAECYDKNSIDDLDKTFKASFKVEGNCRKIVAEKTEITANLQSEEAVAGGDVVIKSTIKNAGDASQTYILSVSGIDNFATLQKIEPQTVTLEPGKSQDVTITLKANDDAEGDYTFTISAKTVSSGKTKEQPVSLTIQPVSGIFSGLTGSAIGESLKSNWLIWVIVLVNIILIILIIVIAVRIARR